MPEGVYRSFAILCLLTKTHGRRRLLSIGGCKARDDEEADWRQPDMSRLFELGAPATEPKKGHLPAVLLWNADDRVRARPWLAARRRAGSSCLSSATRGLRLPRTSFRMAFLAAKSKAEFCGVTGQTEGVYDLLQIRFGTQVVSTSATSSAYAAVSDQTRCRAERQKAREGRRVSRVPLASERRQGDSLPVQLRRADQAKADERREQRRAARQAARASREAPEPIEGKHKAKPAPKGRRCLAAPTDEACPLGSIASPREDRAARSAGPHRLCGPVCRRGPFSRRLRRQACPRCAGAILRRRVDPELGVFVKRFKNRCRKASIPPSTLPSSIEA